MLCDIFPAPSSTEIRADWTKERRDHNVTQTLRHQPLQATTSHYHYQQATMWHKFHDTKISDVAECQTISLIILLSNVK